MSPRDPLAALADMIQACEDIVEATDGVGLAAFMADKLRHKAVVRDLEVLGEASRLVPPEVRALAPEIAWPIMSAMRNRLIHGYFGVDLAIVHTTAQRRIPELLESLRSLIARLPR